MKKTAFVSVLLSIALLLSACGQKMSHHELWASFDCPGDMTVTEEEDSIRAENDGVSFLILRRDATPYVSEDASGWEKEKLDLESGAFDGNFNNSLFVYEFFKYLASEDMLVSPPSQDRLGIDGMMCFSCGFTSPGSSGQMYETVRDDVLYVVVIRVSDDGSGRGGPGDAAETFRNSLSF